MGCLIAVAPGSKSEDVIQVLRQIDGKDRDTVEKVTFDSSDSMRRIVSIAFPEIKRDIARFHIQKLACDAVQEISAEQANKEMEECKRTEKPHVLYRFLNGDTRLELLIRSRCHKWNTQNRLVEIKSPFGLGIRLF